MGTVWHVLHKTLDTSKELMYIDPNDAYCHWGLFVRGGNKMKDEDVISRAWGFATLAHAGQKYGEHPYTRHLMLVTVGANLDERVTEENRVLVCVCAILHDVLEDTATTKNDLRESFKGAGGNFVAGMIDALDRLTKKDVGYNREEYVRGIKGNLVASIVKKADAWCNLSHSIADKHERRIRKYTKLLKDLEE